MSIIKFIEQQRARLPRPPWAGFEPPVSATQAATTLLVICVVVGSVPGLALAAGSSSPVDPSGTPATMATVQSSDLSSDSFEDEAADSGVPDGWEAVVDPMNYGHNRTAVTERVTTETAGDGEQSYHIVENETGNVIYSRPKYQPLSTPVTKNVSFWVNQTTYNPDGGDTVSGLVLMEGTGSTENVRVAMRDGNLTRFDGSWTVISEVPNADEWVNIKIYNIDPDADTYDVYFETESGNTGTIEGNPMVADMVDGYDNTISMMDSEAYFDGFYVPGIGAKVSGQVTDQNGVPVENATVYTTGWNTDEDVTLGGRPLEEVLAEPMPDRWREQVEQVDGFSESEFNPDGDSFSGERVFLHSQEDWATDPVPDNYFVSKAVYEGTLPSDVIPRPAVAPGEKSVFACWEPGTGTLGSITEDPVDSSIPGMVTTDCGGDIVIERVDPLGNVVAGGKRTVTPEVLYDPSIVTEPRSGGKAHYVASVDLSEGVYRVYPEGNSKDAMVYVVAPDGDAKKFEENLGNLNALDSCGDASLQWRRQACEELANLKSFEDLTISTTTDENGQYSMTVLESTDTVSITAVKPGDGATTDPTNYTTDTLRTNFETAVTTNFKAAAATSQSPRENLDANGRDEFRSVCEEMDSVVDDVGTPFVGQTVTGVPNPTADVEGYRLVPPKSDTVLQECATVNIAEAIADDPFNAIPGLVEDISELTDAEALEQARSVLRLINANDNLREEVEDRIGGTLPDDPSNLNDPDRARTILDGGLGEVDNSLGSGYGGGGAPNIGEPDDSVDRIDNTLTREWPVAGVDDWSVAAVLIRINYANGTSDVLDKTSDHVTVTERTARTDRITLGEYPVGNATESGSIDVILDVSTPDGGDRDRGQRRHPSFDGEIPALKEIQVSTLRPGPSDKVVVGVRGGTSLEQVKWVNVTGPNCSTTTAPSSNEATIETCGQGTHRVAATFENPDGVQFTEVVELTARPATQGHPPSVRGMVGPTGRYALSSGLLESELDVSDGASHIEVVAVAESGDIPRNLRASTVGLDTDPDATVDVRVREGETRQTVRNRVGVEMHLSTAPEDTLYWRNGRAMPVDEDVAEGSIERRNKSVVVDTFTDDTGEVRIRQVRDPGILERFAHWRSLKFRSLPLLVTGVDTASVVDVNTPLQGVTP